MIPMPVLLLILAIVLIWVAYHWGGEFKKREFVKEANLCKPPEIGLNDALAPIFAEYVKSLIEKCNEARKASWKLPDSGRINAMRSIDEYWVASISEMNKMSELATEHALIKNNCCTYPPFKEKELLLVITS